MKKILLFVLSLGVLAGFFQFVWPQVVIKPLLFRPQRALDYIPSQLGLKYRDVWLASGGGARLARLHGWWIEPTGPTRHGAVLYLHGNAGNIGGRLERAHGWATRGYAMMLVDYREFGQSQGIIHDQQDLIADAQAAYDWLTESAGIVPADLWVFGESLGSAPAIELALRNPVGGLILEGAFTRLRDLARYHYPALPPVFLGQFSMENIRLIDRLQVPVYFIHGLDDKICPVWMGRALFERARPPKDIFWIPGAGHVDGHEVAVDAFYDRPIEFFRQASQEKKKAA